MAPIAHTFTRFLGVSSMRKAYQGKKEFSYSWYEDIDGSFVVFETL